MMLDRVARYEALGRQIRRRPVGGLRALLRLAALRQTSPFRPIFADRRRSREHSAALDMLTPNEVDQLVAAFDRILDASADPAFYDGATDEDVHTLVIRKLKEDVGPLADKIHTGRSRNEQVSLDTRLWLRDEIDASQADLQQLLRCSAGTAQNVIRRRDPRLYSRPAGAGRPVAALHTCVFRDVLP